MKKVILLLTFLGLLAAFNYSYALQTVSKNNVVSLQPASVQTITTSITVDKPLPPDSSTKNQYVALLLALLVGSFGLHRFYLGYKKIGIIQLVLTLTGVFAIVSYVWSLIDAINIAFGYLKPADGSDYDPKF